MAASVTYQIKGKYDNKAVKSAKADLTALQSSLKAVGVAAWAKIASSAIKGLTTVVNGSTDAFLAQNKASKTLDETIKKSNKDFSELVKHQQKLSRNNFFDDDSIKNAESLAINMGLTQKQVIAVMDAATDLAASGIMPLDQAVKSLSLSYSGNVTTLSKTIPQLKELTKEELANGDAVKIVANQYKGFADSMANTFSGRDTQFKNTFSDLQASVGGLIEMFKFISQGTMIPVLNKITDWVKNNSETIVKSVLSLPVIMKEVFQLISNMFKSTFSSDSIITIFKNMGTIAVSLTKNIFVQIQDLADIMFGNLFDMITKFLGQSGVFRTVDSFLGGLVNKIDAKLFDWLIHLDDWANEHMPKWLKDVLNIGSSNLMINNWMKNRTDAEGNFKAKWNDNSKWEGYNGGNAQFDAALTQFSNDFQKSIDEIRPQLKEFGVDLGEIYGDNLKDFGKTIKKIIDEYELPPDLVKALEKLDIDIQNSNDGTTSGGGLSTSNGQLPSWLSDLTNGGISSELTALTEIAPELGIILELLSNFENVLALMNPLYTIAQSFIETLSPVVNEILAPIVGALKMVGQILAQMLIPLLQTLTPIISFLAEVAVWFYNKVILPVANGIIDVFVFFKNAVVTITNGIIALVNGALGWLGVRIGYLATTNASDYHLQALSTSDLNAAGSTSSTSTTGGAASYTAARDINVNFYYDHSFVNGDAQQIAIMLRDEIARAERLGY